MATLNVSVSALLKRRLKQRAAKKGFASTSEYIRAVLESSQVMEKQGIEEMLVRRLGDSRSVVMDDQDWNRIRTAVRARERRKK